ncbi:MAG: GNAT family N-acetyltransferase [Bacteroidota bacterium]
MDAHLRLLTPDDEAFLWQALYHALHVAPGEVPFPPEVVRQPEIARYVAGWMRRPGDAGFIAEAEGEPIGAAWLRQWTTAEHGFGFVDEAVPELSMALLPAYRGRGAGTLLLEHAARHVDAVSLSVSASNPARRLYERLGFLVVEEAEGGSVTMLKSFLAGEAP